MPPVVGRDGVVGEVEVGAVLVRGGEDAAEDGLGAGLALLGRDAEVAEAVLALSGELLDETKESCVALAAETVRRASRKRPS